MNTLSTKQKAALPPKADEVGVASGVVVIRGPYDGRRFAVRLICVDGEDRTQQSGKDECDINVLMKRYAQTGVLPPARDGDPVYADVSAMDFTASMNQVARVNGFFSRMPADVRARFLNSPAVMLEFCADPANAVEAAKLGLIPAPKAPEVAAGAPVAAPAPGGVGSPGVASGVAPGAVS